MRFLPMGNYSGESDCFVLFYFHQETCNNGRRPVDPNPNYPIYYIIFAFVFFQVLPQESCRCVNIFRLCANAM